MPSKHSKSLKKLQKFWAKKLKSSGFVDMEKRKHPYASLSDLGHRKNFYSMDAFEANQNYYSMARSIATNIDFENKELQKIWELHSEGYSLAEIGKEIKISKQNVYNKLKIIKKMLMLFL